MEEKENTFVIEITIKGKGSTQKASLHKPRPNVQPRLLPSSQKEATITLSLEQPWKILKEELGRAYWTYHIETKSRKGRELIDVTGLGLSSITLHRKKLGL